MKLIYVFSYSVLLFSFLSCDKKDDTPSCPFTVTSVTGTYSLTSLYYRDSPNGSDSQIIGSLAACKRDDLLVLNTNGLFEMQDVGVTCSGGGNIGGSWTISSNTISLESDTYTFLSFDCTKLSIYKTNRIVPGDRTVWVYTKQ